MNEQITKLAELAKTRHEIARVQAKIPEYVPYSGPIPNTLDKFNALPEPWRRQLSLENSGLVLDLMNRDKVAARIRAHDADQAARREALKGLPFTTVEEFNSMSARERSDWSERMSDEQRRVLAGEKPRPAAEGGVWA